MSAPETVDLAVVGAGAAGLMAAIQAGRAGPGLRVVALEGARKVGAKILVSGGGRCNVTHERVVARDFAGGKRRRIDRVLKRFRVEDTRAFFAAEGVDLVREDTGKLFPVANRARVVVEALLRAAHAAGAEVRSGFRVEGLATREGGGFEVTARDGTTLHARRVVLSPGGKSLPKSGSDGWGHAVARELGLVVTEPILPALVPLTLPGNHPLLARAGTTLDATLTLRAGGGGKHLHQVTGSTLITHVGLSGPAVLDISRYFLMARVGDPGAELVASWIPGRTREEVDRDLREVPARELAAWLARRMPRRLAETCLARASLPADAVGELPREARRRLAGVLAEDVLPVTGDLGFAKAEVTAGGVALEEVDARTLEATRVPGLHLAGEVLDVDGRIGGFNFQWAWASGYVAGAEAARLLTEA